MRQPADLCRWWLRLCLVAPLAGLRPAHSLEAADYLSEEHFPGLHLLDVRPGEVWIYKDCKQPEGSPLVLSAGWETMAAARGAFEAALGIPPLEPLQTPWALFDAQGSRVDEVGELLGLRVAFLLEIGQWMWPAVRIGFVQQADGVLEGRPLRLKTLSLRPVVFEVEGFIREEEADAAIAMGKGAHMFNSEGQRTSVDKAANRAHNDYRTSTQAWLRTQQSPVIDALDRRTANLTRVPRTHNEEVQLLRYGEGQFYHSHNDWTNLPHYNGQRAIWLGAHFGWEGRMATLFWYLNDVAEGGETVFPRAPGVICPGFSEVCQGTRVVANNRCDVGLRVQPKRGSVILWYNFHPNGQGDHNALHGGCPPAPGLEKWSGNKWIHIKPLNTPRPEWMEDHPGLKRFGWKGDEMDKLAGAQKRPGDTGKCKLGVQSEHAETLEISWVSPGTKDGTRVGEVHPGSSISMDSWNGHGFWVSHGKKKSRHFFCEKARSSFRISADLEVTSVGPPGEGRAEI